MFLILKTKRNLDNINNMKIISTTPRTKSNSSNFRELSENFGCTYVEKFPNKQSFNSDEMINELNGFSIAIVGDDELDESFFNQSKTLKLIIKWGSGTDNIDYQAASKNKIKIVNTPNILGKYVAEYLLGIILSNQRKIIEYNSTFKLQQSWNKEPGRSLFNKTVGFIGFGNIGTEFAKLVKPFECNTIFYDPNVNSDQSSSKVSLKNLFQNSDILILAAQLNNETRNIVNKNNLKLLKSNSLLINVSRGPLVNEADLFEAINNNELKYVFLDVFCNEPPHLDNYYVDNQNINFSQHNASNSQEAIKEVNFKVMEILKEELQK